MSTHICEICHLPLGAHPTGVWCGHTSVRPIDSHVRASTRELLPIFRIQEPGNGCYYRSSKTYTHAEGLSCCFRQWRADHSHCQYLHGYALEVRIEFGCRELDQRYWVQDFGGLKDIKQWLKDTFDHKTLVAKNDPKISIFRELALANLVQLVEVPAVGCEAFARIIYEEVDRHFPRGQGLHCWVEKVEVREHPGNSAVYGRLELSSIDLREPMFR
jgi:6-pyruvoyltetrahydropterin/6-carboxytetrahydropterin synthase